MSCTAEIEKEIGFRRQSLYQWKNNDLDRVEMRVLDALCKYFKVQPGFLFEYVEDSTINRNPSRKRSVVNAKNIHKAIFAGTPASVPHWFLAVSIALVTPLRNLMLGLSLFFSR